MISEFGCGRFYYGNYLFTICFCLYFSLLSAGDVNLGGRMARRQIKQAEIVRSFAERLRQVRLARGMTQAQLAEGAGVPASYISDLEQAKAAPGIDLVARLATALNTTVAELLSGGSGPPSPDQRRQLREVFDGLLAEANPDVLASLAALLPLLRELSTRRR